MKECLIIILLFCTSVFGSQARTVYLSDSDMTPVRLVAGRSTVISFPIRPKKVIVGNQGVFAVEYVESDLAISPLQPNARSNLFVYMEGRRFAFDLKTIQGNGDEILLVRDIVEKPVRGKNGK